MITLTSVQFIGCSNKENEYIQKATDLIIEKKFDEAEKMIMEALKINPQSPTGLNNLGYIYMNQSRYDEAVQKFDEALKNYEKSEDKAVVYNNLGMVKEKMNDPEQAEKYYNLAIETDPQYVITYVNLGLLKESQGALAEASTIFQSALKFQPNNKSLLHHTGTTALRSKDYKLAQLAFDKLRQIDPFNPGNQTYLGIIYLQLNDEESNPDLLIKAKQSLDSAVTLDPKNALAHAGLAGYFLAKNQLDESKTEIDNAFKLDPELAYAHIVFGKLLMAEGKNDEARDILQKGMVIDPQNDVIPTLLEKLKG
jgi:Tfp pilus assembly protein PilF